MIPAVAVVPVRGGTGGKSRLGSLLGRHDRGRLVATLARHVVGTLTSVPGVERVLVVTTDPAFVEDALAGLGGPVAVVAQGADRPGLVAGLDAARETVVSWGGAPRLLVVHADLPALGADDVAALLAVAGPVVLAPDLAGTGTNALVLERAGAAFAFRFGRDSLARHRAEARALGWVPVEVRRPGLAVDLDTPADWSALPDPVRRRIERVVPATADLGGAPASVGSVGSVGGVECAGSPGNAGSPRSAGSAGRRTPPSATPAPPRTAAC